MLPFTTQKFSFGLRTPLSSLTPRGLPTWALFLLLFRGVLWVRADESVRRTEPPPGNPSLLGPFLFPLLLFNRGNCTRRTFHCGFLLRGNRSVFADVQASLELHETPLLVIADGEIPPLFSRVIESYSATQTFRLAGRAPGSTFARRAGNSTVFGRPACENDPAGRCDSLIGHARRIFLGTEFTS